MAKTQITTGRCRLSYVSVFEPKLMPDNKTKKFSVTLLIPKEDVRTLTKIEDAKEAAIDQFKAKNPAKRLPRELPFTLHDGDGLKDNGDEYGPECRGCMVMTVTSAESRPPVVVYSDKTPITEPSEIYSGCFGKAVINLFVYDTAGKIGVTAGLNGVMKLSDGEPLAGGVITDADWDEDEDDDDII